MRAGGWIGGEEHIVYQQCGRCRHIWYFRRGFCPGCGSATVQDLVASGLGRVCAITTVHRAPSEALAQHLPYLLVMIDADEGFRLMGQGRAPLQIGDRARARFIHFGGRLIPCFERVDPGGDNIPGTAMA